MFARIVKCIPRLRKKEEFLKKGRPATRTHQVTAINGMTHDEAMLEWARGLAIILIPRVGSTRDFDCWQIAAMATLLRARGRRNVGMRWNSITEIWSRLS